MEKIGPNYGKVTIRGCFCFVLFFLCCVWRRAQISGGLNANLCFVSIRASASPSAPAALSTSVFLEGTLGDGRHGSGPTAISYLTGSHRLGAFFGSGITARCSARCIMPDLVRLPAGQFNDVASAPPRHSPLDAVRHGLAFYLGQGRERKPTRSRGFAGDRSFRAVERYIIFFFYYSAGAARPAFVDKCAVPESARGTARRS